VTATIAETTTSRRNFLANGIKAIAGFFILALGIPLTGFTISSALKKDKHDWIEAAELGDLSDDKPTRITYHYRRKDGWMTTESRKTAFVVKEGNDAYTVFASRCTHLGCGLDWDATTNQFKCPCHGGVFDAHGNVVEGPPPRPLVKLGCKIEGRKLFVMEA
jgi:Rieske Fe-S protein